MYLTAFLHREALFDITNRWLSNRLREGDPLAITKIITYDSFAAWDVLQEFIDALLTPLIRAPLHKRKLRDKKELKDFICNVNFQSSEHIQNLIASYRNMSEFYYVGSPMAGYIHYNEHRRLACISRFKRVKRIAEKASRYASMILSESVKTTARELTDLMVNHADSTTEKSLDQLLKAEKEVMDRIKNDGITLPVEPMKIMDILGAKIIDHGFGERALEAVISEMPGVTIVEKERHSGNYNAIHYVVEVVVDFDYLIQRFNDSHKSFDCTKRGLSQENIQEDFARFLVTGSNSIQLDLILTTFEELIESEIGRSMHETRIFLQRQQQTYFGNIPTNVEYIIEYLLAVALSPVVFIDEIPIKIWGRYLPDSLSYSIRKLYNMPEHSLIEI